MASAVSCCDAGGSRAESISGDPICDDVDFVDDLPKVDKVFKKTHKRDESRISKISRLSIKSLKGLDGVDGASDAGDKIDPTLLGRVLSKCFGSWCSDLSFRRLLPPLWGFNSELEWRSSSKFESRVLVIGNKFSEHLFQRLDIDLTNKQIHFGDSNSKKSKGNSYKTAKYSIWSFVPLNIFEQFRRIANMYFLVTLIMTYVIDNSPVDGTSWLLSMFFVLIVTMIKQAYEDYLRHQNDKEVNKRPVQVIRNGSPETILSEQIRVGDIIYLRKDETVPCDAVVLATSHQGQCYVMTANLDGETSLKTKEAASMTKECNDHSRIDHVVSCIECENPNPKLDQFLGRMFRFGSDNQIESSSLSTTNIILAGSLLKNTEEIWAVAVYTGRESKMSLNTKITKNKFSSLEGSLNKVLLFLCALLVTEITVSTVLSLTYGIEFIDAKSIAPTSLLWVPLRGARLPGMALNSLDKSGGSSHTNDDDGGESPEDFHWYIFTTARASTERGVLTALTFLILYSYIIPISLYVSLEVQKFFSTKFFSWDLELYDGERDIPATSNTSDVNEELGLITHLFTDKTGTLTQNVMTFKKFSGPDGDLVGVEDLSKQPWAPFMAAMTLCHSVVVTSDGKFAASSPDEAAILEKCSEAGFVFLGEESDGIVSVQVPGPENQVLKFKKLAELPFDSNRKCMSVVIRETSASGQESIYVYTKGAESAVLESSVEGPVDATRRAVDEFASEGLRTLVFAFKKITKDEFEDFAAKLAIAKFSIVNRFRFVRETYMAFESGLTLLGATGIEDKLQDEVEVTISKLKKSGIVVWMLTGDKKETAVNLAHASGLLTPRCKAYDLCAVTDRESLVKLLNEIHEECMADPDGRWRESSIIVDGKAVVAILKSISMKEKFSTVTSKCRTVVACRLAPVQKSQLVRMIKESSAHNVTAAIGDGGNDISMIQEAHVGIGIYGREGHAAAQAADFSVSEFRHLQRVFLVHGHWYYNRLAFLVQYSFYKQIACFTCQLMFAIYSNFSGTSLFESIFLFLFNTIYTSVPVVVYGLSEQTFPQNVLLENPELYRLNRGNREMMWYRMLIWLLVGLWHAGCVFFVWLFSWQSVDIYGCGLQTLGGVVAGSAVAVTNLKICLEARFWSWPLLLSIAWSIFSYVVGTIIYDQWLIDNFLADNSDQLQTYTSMFRTDTVLIHLAVNVLILTMALLPDTILVVFRNHRRLSFLQQKSTLNQS